VVAKTISSKLKPAWNRPRAVGENDRV